MAQDYPWIDYQNTTSVFAPSGNQSRNYFWGFSQAIKKVSCKGSIIVATLENSIESDNNQNINE
jgi:hypothetical protein